MKQLFALLVIGLILAFTGPPGHASQIDSPKESISFVLPGSLELTIINQSADRIAPLYETLSFQKVIEKSSHSLDALKPLQNGVEEPGFYTTITLSSGVLTTIWKNRRFHRTFF